MCQLLLNYPQPKDFIAVKSIVELSEGEMHWNWKYLKMKSSSHCPWDTWQLLGQSGDWVNSQ